DESVTAHRQAVAGCEALVDQFPNAAPYRHQLANCLNRLGIVQAKLGKESEAEPLFRRAYELWEGLYQKYPENVEYQQGFAGAHQTLGNTCDSLGRTEEAERLLRRGMELFESVLRKDADNVFTRSDEDAVYARGDCAITAMTLGIALTKLNRYEEA